MSISVVMYADETPKEIVEMGRFSPDKVLDLVELVKQFGAWIGECEYVYFTSGFDLESGRFEIILMEGES
jgi:hypothetical protein